MKVRELKSEHTSERRNKMTELYMVLPFVVAVITTRDRKILIGRHPYLERKPYPGLWDIPGGKVEEGEPFEKALAREVLEETGLEVVKSTLLAVFHHAGNNILPIASPVTVPGIALCYATEVWGDLVPTELEGMHWADATELQTLELTPWLRYLLNNHILL